MRYGVFIRGKRAIKYMKWYEEVLDEISAGRTYSHGELVSKLKSLKSNMSNSTYHWSISSLVSNGKLLKLGYDSYSLPEASHKKQYYPDYSNKSIKLIKVISKKYPHVLFTVFETALMNDFLNHLVAQNTIFLQVEKESSIYVFRFLQEAGYKNVMYNPSKKEFDLYWSKDCIVVTDMISESPVFAVDSYLSTDFHSITLEKILVDMLSDKLISTTYSIAEFSDVIAQAKSVYLLDKVRMLRYAARRNRRNMLVKYLEG
ncbi:DUF6577 family protein [Gardnerella vaginalis]|uniref:DUF6577 family protein n=1 Tax=Gardnerella vaginalis TaxID=2702 RepID=UPI0039EFD93C